MGRWCEESSQPQQTNLQLVHGEKQTSQEQCEDSVWSLYNNLNKLNYI